MDGAVDTAAASKRSVCRVHDRVDRELGDIALMEREARVRGHCPTGMADLHQTR
jgi:hypothetical protein